MNLDLILDEYRRIARAPAIVEVQDAGPLIESALVEAELSRVFGAGRQLMALGDDLLDIDLRPPSGGAGGWSPEHHD